MSWAIDDRFFYIPPLLPGSHTAPYPRINPPAFTAGLIAGVATSGLLVIIKLFMSVRRFGKPCLDDYMLVVALFCATAGSAITIWYRNPLYTAPYIQMGVVPLSYLVGIDIEQTTLSFCHIETTTNFLQWFAIFMVKFSYLVFFKKLINRVRAMRIWWWVVMGVTIPCALFNIFFDFYSCPQSDMPNLGVVWSLPIIFQHGTLFMRTSLACDVFTDFLIISIPLWLIWQVQINLRRKFALAGILSLSIFMVIVACIRTFVAPLPDQSVLDLVWLEFWTSMEGCIAICMVSLTAYRSIFGQVSPRKPSNSRISRKVVSWRRFWSDAFRSRLSSVSRSSRTRTTKKSTGISTSDESTLVAQSQKSGTLLSATDVKRENMDKGFFHLPKHASEIEMEPIEVTNAKYFPGGLRAAGRSGIIMPEPLRPGVPALGMRGRSAPNTPALMTPPPRAATTDSSHAPSRPLVRIENSRDRLRRLEFEARAAHWLRSSSFQGLGPVSARPRICQCGRPISIAPRTAPPPTAEQHSQIPAPAAADTRAAPVTAPLQLRSPVSELRRERAGSPDTRSSGVLAGHSPVLSPHNVHHDSLEDYDLEGQRPVSPLDDDENEHEHEVKALEKL